MAKAYATVMANTDPISLHHGLFANNTAFEHTSRHKTSWTQWVKDQNAPVHSTVTKPVYSQIDYVLCKTSAKSLLTDAHCYGRATLPSDHKPVVACLQFVYIPLVWGQGPMISKALYGVRGLTSDSALQEVYCEDLNDCVGRIQPSADTSKPLADMLDCVKKSAEATIGRVPTNKTTHYCQDDRVADLSQQQRQLP